MTVAWEIPFLTVIVTVPKVALRGIVIRPSASTKARAVLLLVYTVPVLLLVISFRFPSPMVAVTTSCLVNPAAKVTVAGVTAMLLISVAGFLATVTIVVDWSV
ncbi:hypothetical protein D3C86_1296360 [compost metagenome]